MFVADTFPCILPLSVKRYSICLWVTLFMSTHSNILSVSNHNKKRQRHSDKGPDRNRTSPIKWCKWPIWKWCFSANNSKVHSDWSNYFFMGNRSLDPDIVENTHKQSNKMHQHHYRSKTGFWQKIGQLLCFLQPMCQKWSKPLKFIKSIFKLLPCLYCNCKIPLGYFVKSLL